MTFVINLVIFFIGEDRLAAITTGVPFVGEFITGLIGLIPNCAASVVITQLYLGGIISFGQLMSGLLVGAGVGLLVLFRVNDDRKNDIMITAMLYVIGVISGLIIELTGFAPMQG